MLVEVGMKEFVGSEGAVGIKEDGVDGGKRHEGFRWRQCWREEKGRRG